MEYVPAADEIILELKGIMRVRARVVSLLEWDIDSAPKGPPEFAAVKFIQEIRSLGDRLTTHLIDDPHAPGAEQTYRSVRDLARQYLDRRGTFCEAIAERTKDALRAPQLILRAPSSKVLNLPVFETIARSFPEAISEANLFAKSVGQTRGATRDARESITLNRECADRLPSGRLSRLVLVDDSINEGSTAERMLELLAEDVPLDPTSLDVVIAVFLRVTR
ncbi:MAG: hypothetical protein M9894_17625 [Planctomycetes bacterium]|nr:hypothetical protein [Planctomycetota bacterium]